MTYNVFGGTLSLSQSINPERTPAISISEVGYSIRHFASPSFNFLQGIKKCEI